MPLVTTVPKKGESAKVFDVPEAELSKYEEVEAYQETYDQSKDRVAEGEELAGGMDLDKADVQAYSHICICWIYWGHRWYYRYQYCWQSCP